MFELLPALELTVAEKTLAVSLVIIFIAVGLSYLRQRLRIYTLFGLSVFRYRLISADMGKVGRKKIYRGRDLTGAPDVVFADRLKPRIIVCEYKSRLAKNRVKKRERYQVVLYIGLLQEIYPRHRIEGRLRYRDKVVDIGFDPQLYSWLLSLKTPCLKATS